MIHVNFVNIILMPPNLFRYKCYNKQSNGVKWKHKISKQTISFLSKFRQMSSQLNHWAILYRAKSNATKKGRSISFYD